MAGEYKVKVKNPARPDDALIEVHGFGHVENGSSFAAILTKREVERYQESPIFDIAPTKRKKSDLNDDDLRAWEAAQAIEDEEEAEEAAVEAAVEGTPVAGEESIEATDPIELPTAPDEEVGN